MVAVETSPRSGPRIAVFDSGVGGLTVVAAVHRALPCLDVRFLGDTARLPYGTKSEGTVIRYALQAAAALVREPVDALVVACNTASSCALPALRAAIGCPVLGVVDPGARSAVAVTRSGHIGVIGTERTVASGAYLRAISALRRDAVVHSLATPLLVSLAEEGWFDHPATEAALLAYFTPWFADPAVREIDTLVLGCTHYPVFKAVLSRTLERLTGHAVTLVDSADAVAQELQALLPGHTGAGHIELLATDAVERFVRVGALFFPVDRASVHLVDL